MSRSRNKEVRSPTPSISGMTTGGLDKDDSIRIKAPNTYDGNRAKLTPFLT